MATGRFISYLRVSTVQQGRSGLGIEAQRQAVADYLNGGRWKLLAEFVEQESGRKVDRPQLAAALAACRVHRATLVIAKFDRLARNAHFLLGLQDSGIDFVAADMPQANRLTLGIMALVAEQEATAASVRTKAALAAAKARGVRLGNPGNLKDQAKGTARSAAVRAYKASHRAADLAGTISDIRSAGVTTATGIARALNERQITTARGSQWQAIQVQRLIARLAA
jgi:DNA invertase Pin-like site-specific DNA recombinase